MKSAVRPASYIPTLDGWRALAILAVILSHSQDELQAWCPDLSPSLLGALKDFRLGVDVFFAISGYLITTQLISDEENQDISLRRFYIKRVFRIIPPYAFYLLFIIAARWFGNLLSPTWYLFISAVFLRNYWGENDPSGIYTNHFWSLAVEEHFYLFWPLILTVCGWRRALWITPVMALSIHFWRFLVTRYKIFMIGSFATSIIWRTDTRIDALLWGCVLALLLKRFPIWIPSFSTPLVLVSIAAALCFQAPSLPLIQALLFPVLILSTIVNEKGLFGRFLELSPLRFIGRLSYSLYIWQTLFLSHTLLPDPNWLYLIKETPLTYVVIFFCALGSYYCIEKPCIRFGRRLSALQAHPKANVSPIENATS